MPDSNYEALIQTFQSHLLQGESYARINQARAQAEAVLGQAVPPGSPLTKVVDEAMEAAIVRVAPLLIAQTNTTHQAYDSLVDLLQRQPTLAVRSTTSILQQAYSTPIPIAYFAATLAGITPESTVYEPTVGNGALVQTADPRKVIANELNSDRYAEVSTRGFRQLTQYDATQYKPDTTVDVVITNPPFGTRRDRPGRREWFELPGNQRGTNQIDHAIAMKALECLKDDGRAVLILGGKQGTKPDWRSDQYNTLLTAGFYYALYQQYNVTDHFTVWGDLYRKQGAGFPIDFVLINGRGQSERALPAVDVPRILYSFDDLKELLPNVEITHTRSVPSVPIHLDTLPTAGERLLAHPPPESVGTSVNAVPGVDATSIRVSAPELDGSERRVSAIADALSAAAIAETAIEPGSASTRGRSVELGNGVGRDTDPAQRDGLPTTQAAKQQPQFSDPDTSQDTRGTGQAATLTRRNDTERMALGTDAGEIVMTEPAANDTDLLTGYAPGSKGRSPGTLTPSNLAVPSQVALQRLQSAVGDIDEFVRQRVGYQSVEALHSHLYAEQIDAAAMAFWQRDRGKTFLNADQTGNGKGRWCGTQVMGVVRQGETAVWVTQQKDLYASAMGDLTDIGAPNLRVFSTDNNLRLELPNGQVLKTGSPAQQEAEMRRIMSGEVKYDLILTTYSQMQTVGGKEPFRRQFFRQMAPELNFVMDEAHNAGGQTGQGESKETARSRFVRTLVDRAKSVVFATATAVKDPDVLDLYARRSDVQDVVSVALLQNALRAGGVPLQQMITAKFVESGQMLRRERSYEGVNVRVETVPVNREAADKLYACMGAISRFDIHKEDAVLKMREALKAEAKAAWGDSATGDVGARSTNFSSLMHNLVDQSLLGLKAEAVSQLALDMHGQGQKPVIACVSTMESHIQRYAEEKGLRPGDLIDLTFTDLLRHNLERSRDVITRDYQGEREKRPMTDDELGFLAVDAYEEAMALINDTDLSNVPISFLDYEQKQLDQAGVKVGEITGRSVQLEYGDAGSSPTYQVRPDAERNTQAKVSTVAGFNNGQLDALTINAAGFTGISIHASERYADQSQRHLVMSQAHSDINQVIQLFGRVHRFGQVQTPEITVVVSDLPAERRIAAVLADRMARLNANTTANRDSSLSIISASHFFSEYGEAAIETILDDYPEYNNKLEYPRDVYSNGDSELELISRVTGRMPLMSIEDQEALYELIDSEVAALIDQDRLMGRNPLAAGQLDLDARTLARVELVPPTKLGNPFGGAVYAELVDTKAPVQPMTQLEAINTVRQVIGLPQVDQVDAHDFREAATASRAWTDTCVQQVRNAAQDYKKELESKEGANLDTAMTRLQKQGTHVLNVVNAFPPGTAVEMKLPTGHITYGVIADIAQHKHKGSPLAPSNWQATIVAQDYARVFPVRLSNFNTGAKGHEIRVAPAELTMQGQTVYEAFDSRQGSARQERVVLRGNLLAAYEKNPFGQFAYYTTQQGERLSGMIMPRDYDHEKLEEDLQKIKPQFRSVETVKQFLTQTMGAGIVATEDGSLELKGYKQNADKFTLNAKDGTAASRFCRNEEFVAIIGQDFFSVGQGMRTEVPAERLDVVVQWLLKADRVNLVADSEFEVAREILGQRQPELEWLNVEVELPSLAEPTPLQVAPLEPSLPADSPPQVDATPQAGEPGRQAEKLNARLVFDGGTVNLSEAQLATIAETVAQTATVSELVPRLEAILQPDLDLEDRAWAAEAIIQTYQEQGHSFLPTIAAWAEQPDVSAELAAQVLHDSGLVDVVMAGERFQLEVKNHPYPPLMLDRSGDRLSLSLHAEQEGERVLAESVTFKIGVTGKLQLEEAYLQDPVQAASNAGVRNAYRNDEETARLICGELLVQKYGEAAKVAWEVQQQFQQESLFDLSPLVTTQAEVEAAIDPVATAAIATPLGDLTVKVFESSDDFLRLEFAGPTANWLEYPSQERIDHLSRSDLAEMDGVNDPAAYAEFAVQQVHVDFVQHLDQEATRIAPALHRWLQQQASDTEVIAADFLAVYPERDRIGLTPAFMQLAIQTVMAQDAEQALERSATAQVEPQGAQPSPVEAGTTRILPSGEQFGKAEKTIAKYLDQTELATAIFNVPEPEHEFHLRVENEPYLPLVIERHDDRLYFTHYREIESDLVLDGEMVFEVANTGHLKLCETAVQNPFTGWESRRLDKGFGAVFAQNIMAQGFVEATRDAWAQKLAAQETVDVQPKALEQADVAPTQETFTIGGGIVYEVNEGEVSYQGLDPTHPQYPRPAEQPSLAVPVPVLSQPQPATSSDSAKTSQAVVPTPDEAPVVLATEPALAQSFQELQAKYPHYAFEQSQLAGIRYSDTHLWLRDEHGSHVGSVNVTVTGDRLSYQQADELIQRHEEKLQRPGLVALRAEFPQLRFEDHLVHMGRVVTAIDKSDGKHVATGIAEDEHGSTPERLEAFKQQLREAGYGLQAAPVMAAEQTISPAETAPAEVVTLTAFDAPLEAEVSPESLRETELVRGQEILDVAARAFAYGEAIGALVLEENNEFWTVPSTNYDISYNLENDNFFVVGKAGSEMIAQTIGGDLDPDCTGGITEADSQAFKDTASALDQISYHTQQSPSETVELAQAKLEQAAAPMPVAAVSASGGEHSLFDASQYASTPLPATPYMVDPVWAKLEAASSSTQSPVAAQTATADSGNQPAEAQKQAQEPITLNDVRNWYRQARDIGRSDRHLEKIEQIGKAFRQGEALSDRDTKAMAKDGSAWCEQALTIAQQARDILQSQGEPTDSGNGIVYEGKTYTVFACQDHLYALAKGRGVEPTATDRQNLPSELLEAKQGIILKVEQGEPDVRSTRVTNADAHRFEMIANRLQRQEQRLENESNRLHVVGYDR